MGKGAAVEELLKICPSLLLVGLGYFHSSLFCLTLFLSLHFAGLLQFLQCKSMSHADVVENC